MVTFTRLKLHKISSLRSSSIFLSCAYILLDQLKIINLNVRFFRITEIKKKKKKLFVKNYYNNRDMIKRFIRRFSNPQLQLQFRISRERWRIEIPPYREGGRERGRGGGGEKKRRGNVSINQPPKPVLNRVTSTSPLERDKRAVSVSILDIG